MKKKLIISAILILVSAAFMPGLFPTRAWFTSEDKSALNVIRTGTLDVKMDVQEIPGSHGHQPPGRDCGWLPGNHRKWLVNIANRGTLDARFRLGIQPKPPYEGGEIDRNLILHLFLVKDGKWGSFATGPLVDYTVGSAANNWIYSDQLDQEGWLNNSGDPARKGILKAGDSCQLGIIIEFPRTAGCRLQGKKFDGKLVLQAAQVDAGWQP